MDFYMFTDDINVCVPLFIKMVMPVLFHYQLFNSHRTTALLIFEKTIS